MGSANRNAPIARNASVVAMTSLSANGVPGRGSRKFIGTSVGFNSARSDANSARCSRDSPMPKMPPEHTSMPAAATMRSVSRRDSHV